MRLLHTSDWHLGRSFHGAGLLDAQRAFADALVATVAEQSVDVVLVAGDVYDRALPGVDVVTLFDESLVRLREAGAQVVVTSGNHDSATRLGFGGRLFASAGLHLRTRVEDLDTPVLFHGSGFDLAVYGLPYLEPRMVAARLGVEEPGHPPVVAAALDRVRADLRQRRDSADRPVHSLVMAHVFAAGGIPAESERDLSVGGLDIVPVPYFEDFDYAALGHLHGRQELAESVRYCGSPLPYSFAEADQSKGGLLVDFDASGLRSVRAVEWPCPQPLAVLRGDLEDLLSGSEYGWAEAAWCQVTLTDAERPARAMERLRERFPDTLVLHFDPQGREELPERSYSERLAEAQNPLEVCCGFVEHVRQRAADDAESGLLAEVLAEAASEAVSR